MADKPHPTDLHVGRAMRTFRLRAGLSQENLGDMIGTKFQQIQKYESGYNRVSASRLKAAADALKVSVSDFFAGLDDKPNHSLISQVLADPAALETARIIHALPELARQGLQGILAAMAAA